MRIRTALLAAGLVVAGRAAAQSPADAIRVRAAAQYRQLALRFEANQGQAPAEVQYLARGAGYGFFLTGKGAVLALGRPDRSVRVDMRLVGARPASLWKGLDAQPGTSHYYIGSDPRQWREATAQYGRVERSAIYTGHYCPAIAFDTRDNSLGLMRMNAV